MSNEEWVKTIGVEKDLLAHELVTLQNAKLIVVKPLSFRGTVKMAVRPTCEHVMPFMGRD